MNFETPDPAINLDIVANEPRESKCRYNPVQQLWFWRPECLPVLSSVFSIAGLPAIDLRPMCEEA